MSLRNTHASSFARYAPRRCVPAIAIGLLSQALMLPLAAAQSVADVVDLPIVYAVSVAPGAGATLDEARTAFLVRSVDAEELDRLQVMDITDALNRRVVGLSLNTVQGNPFQPDLQYRGFTGSPLLGTPQGLAVYQDGVRVNEVFGDTVNWDLLPVAALERVEVIAGANPVFGLNTLGGAISLTSKDGFSAPGTAARYEAGSFGRRQAGLESGGNNERFGYYVYTDDLREDGWRELSPSRARHAFASFGWRGDKTTLDLILAHANTRLTGNGAAPVELLAEDRGAIFTAPDETDNRLDQATLRGTHAFADDALLSASVSSRRVRTHAYNGDGSDAEECEAEDSILCEDDGDQAILGQSGQPVSSEFDAINNIGTRRQRAQGGNVQF
ncbi:MAG: TonB-dependent receptor, partial [Oxalobacteraceae bacterium]